MSEHDTTYFANASGDPESSNIGIARSDRRYHMYCIGRTGTGKSTMLANMIIQDLTAGRGVALIDPHGDLAQQVLAFVPATRKNHLVYFNPADIDYPIGLNILERVEASERPLVAANLMSVFKKSWSDSWGPRMSYLLHNALLALLENSGSTLLGMVRLLADERFRSTIVGNVEDPVVRHYWEKEFASFPKRLLPEVVSPVQNKIGAYLTHRALRNILGQNRSLNFGHLMNANGILIANLSKGLIGEDAANLLGSLLVTKLQLAAMARAAMPEHERQDFYLYVDEFHNFTTDSFADILAEARKYRLNLILAHQYLGQLSERTRNAVLANVGTMVMFRLGPDDAKILTKEIEPHYEWSDLVNLSAHEVIYKLLRKGKIDRPHHATTLAPMRPLHNNSNAYRQELIEHSRRRHARPRHQVEQRIDRFFHSRHDSNGR